MFEEFKPLAAKLTSFCQKRLKFDKPPKLFLKSDIENSQNALGKTAHYDPSQKSITIFVSGRHIKDVLRSLSHELVHHSQNLRGDLTPEKCGNLSNNYAQENEHMRNMEKEAYLVGNMNFRDWEDEYKFSIKESIILKENKKMTKKISKANLVKLIKEAVSRRLTTEFTNEPDPGSVEKEFDFDLDFSEDELSEIGSYKRDDQDEDDIEEELEEASQMPDHPDVDGDGDKEEPISKAQKDKKEEDEDEEESDKDLSKVPPQLRQHVSGKANESVIQTPEQEEVLYESRFGNRNEKLFNKLSKLWAK